MIYLKLLIVAFIWGGTFIATRIAAQHLEPFSGAFLRFVFGSIGLVSVVWVAQKGLPRLTPRTLGINTAMALTGIIGYNYFFFNALHLIPVSRASLLVALGPVIILMASVLLFGEKFSWIKAFGALVSLFGAVTVISRGQLAHVFDHFGAGEAFALGCPASWAVYTLIFRQTVAEQNPLSATTWSTLLGTAGLLPLALWEGLPLRELPVNVWVALLFLGLLGTVLGFVWFAEGIQKIGATQASIFINLVPVFGVLLSVWLLGEQVQWPVIAGGALVLLGVAVINFGSNFSRIFSLRRAG